MGLPKQILNLSDSFASLPGVGPKLSNRLALYLTVNAKPLAKKLSSAIEDSLASIKQCSVCGNITDELVCEICADEKRNKTVIMVVEDSLDLYNFESSGSFEGVYHVLGGLISPINGIGVSDINIQSLFSRVRNDQGVKEIIFSLNPTIEGDSTSMYIKSEISKGSPDIEFSQLAKGISSGSDIEFISSQTLGDSLRSRVKF
ncbi:MAG: recombination mediator RecR [Candidatus Dojkabacteria bacterium]